MSDAPSYVHVHTRDLFTAGFSGLVKGDALDLITAFHEAPELVVTDPPYALRGDGDEHAISATVAIVLREAATRLKKGGWMLVMCASSWRSQAYMVEAVRGIVEPVRTLTWCKPTARTKAKTSGPAFASVQVLVFKKGKSLVEPATMLDHITAPPVTNGRRAELPPEVADWMVGAYGRPGDLMLDPFAGSGATLAAAERLGIRAIGFEKNPLSVAACMANWLYLAGSLCFLAGTLVNMVKP